MSESKESIGAIDMNSKLSHHEKLQDKSFQVRNCSVGTTDNISKKRSSLLEQHFEVHQSLIETQRDLRLIETLTKSLEED